MLEGQGTVLDVVARVWSRHQPNILLSEVGTFWCIVCEVVHPLHLDCAPSGVAVAAPSLN